MERELTFSSFFSSATLVSLPEKSRRWSPAIEIIFVTLSMMLRAEELKDESAAGAARLR